MEKIWCLLIFIIGIARYLFATKRKDDDFLFHLTTMIIQSLAFYPLAIMTMRVPELTQKLDFSSPYESYSGVYFPTMIAALIHINYINHSKRWNIREVLFPVVFFLFGFLYSYVTPYNQSRYATTIGLLVISQVFYVIYVLKTFVPISIIKRAIYDGCTIIVVVNFVISFTYVILRIDTLQNLFINFEGNIRVGSHYYRAYGTTNQPNRLAALSSIISIYFLVCNTLRYKKEKSLIMFILGCIVVLLSQSRSSFSAMLITSVFVFFVLQYKMNKMKLVNALSYIVLIFIFWQVISNLEIFQDMFMKHSNVDEMSEARMGHYALGWLCVTDSNYLGVGINANTHYLQYAIKNFGFESWLYMHSIHSVHMGIFAELGIWGLLLWVYFLITRISRLVLYKMESVVNPLFGYTFLGCIIIVAVHGMTDNVFMHYQYLMFLFMFGAFYKIPQKIR